MSVAATRERLPDVRESVTHRFQIRPQDMDPVKGYVTVGLYEDGRVGEIFVKIDKQGTQVSGFCDAWAISVSMLLQLGYPLDAVCRKFRLIQFEPSGMTDNPEIRFARSPVDYISRWLEMRFLGGPRE